MMSVSLPAAATLALAMLGSACQSSAEPAAAPEGPAAAAEAVAAPPASVGDAAVAPAAPPASNAGADAALTPADTTQRLDGETAALFDRIVATAEAERWAALPYGELVQRVGEALRGQPYVAGMLDEPAAETLVVSLRAFDCVLYVENVLAIARAIALGTPTYAAYADGVRQQRYRGGEMGAYCSRLHYFSDWIRDNDARGWVDNVTAEIGGVRFDKTIDFMSQNRGSYPRLDSDETYACIVETEADLAGVELFYIPQERIAEAYPMLQPGDIIATATSIGGLDVTHTGFVHQTPEHTGFMHASLSSEQVKISDDLAAYVQGIRSQIGIVVARPVDPRG